MTFVINTTVYRRNRPKTIVVEHPAFLHVSPISNQQLNQSLQFSRFAIQYLSSDEYDGLVSSMKAVFDY